MTGGRRARTSGVAILVVVIAACSGQMGSRPPATVNPPLTATPVDTPAPTPLPTPAPTLVQSPTPEPTPDLAGIGAAYLALADEFNAMALPAVEAISAGGLSDAEQVAFHQQVVDAFDAAIADLDAIDFPPQLAEEVTGLRAAWVIVRQAFATTLADPTFEALPVLSEQSATYVVLADRVREYLGLPPRPTPTPVD